MEIARAVKNADIVVICLSKGSVSKSGYVQKEIRFALSVADEKPDGAIFIIPARLEECDVPDRLQKWQWVDLFKMDGYSRLLLSLRANLSRKDAAEAFAKETGTRLQSGLANIPAIYIPLPEQVSVTDPISQITITLQPTGSTEIDKRRIKTIYGTLISFHGRDRFSFQIFENGRGHLIDFPKDTTRICEELFTRLNKILDSDKAYTVEPIRFI